MQTRDIGVLVVGGQFIGLAIRGHGRRETALEERRWGRRGLRLIVYWPRETEAETCLNADCGELLATRSYVSVPTRKQASKMLHGLQTSRKQRTE